MLDLQRFFQPVLLVSLILLAFSPAQAEDEKEVISDGKQVSFFYKLTVDGEVIEDNNDLEPLVYLQGGEQILPALEAGLEGMAAGDKKTITLAAADAYGERDATAIQEIPIDQVPEEAREVGMALQAQGRPGPILVTEVREDVVVLDFNHPLAGKELTFDVTIADVSASSN
jgi:FKBP-type peptidyl-prolyl cis-trans isomerase SlyD